MVELLNKTIPLFIDNSGEVVKEIVKNNSIINTSNTLTIIQWSVWLLILILIFIFRNSIKEKIQQTKGNLGYLKIWMKLENQKIKEKLIKIDQFKNFTFKGSSFNLDKMQTFIYGYDKNNVPIFLYDKNFIIPLKVDRIEVTNEITKLLNDAGIEKTEEWVEAIMLRIDSSTYNMAWDRKLLKDLYDISKNKPDIWKYIIIAVIAVVIFILVQTGALQEFLNNIQNIGK